jgi:hypothetical protein
MEPMSRTRRARGVVATLAAGALISVGVLATAPPASAAPSIQLIGVQPTGTVGITQNLTIQANNVSGLCGSTQAPTASVYGTPPSGGLQLLGTATLANCTDTGGGTVSYQYTYQFVPNAPQTWYLQANVTLAGGGTYTSATSPSTISPVATVTTLSAPNTVKVGQAVTLTATVTAQGGSLFSPNGTINFSVVGGGSIGTATLNNAVPAIAQIQWTPGVAGGVNLIATYTPANNGLPYQAATCGSSCVSAPDNVQVTTSGVNVYIANPPSLAAGIPSTLTAVVGVVPPSGTVTFLINGSSIGTAPVQPNGYATINWTPGAPGTYGLTVNWLGSGGLTGSATENVSVGAQPAQADQIIITGSNGTTLTNGATYQVPNGTVISFTSRTASGAPVTITETGPCTLTANSITATQGSGQCNVTATSPGGNGYGPATITAVAALVPGTQTAKLAAPASGDINAGKTVTLAKASQDETAQGQTISWKITKGSGSICSLSFPSNGAVKLKLKKKGQCNVQAKAKAVSGQWNAYSKTYKYKAV